MNKIYVNDLNFPFGYLTKIIHESALLSHSTILHFLLFFCLIYIRRSRIEYLKGFLCSNVISVFNNIRIQNTTKCIRHNSENFCLLHSVRMYNSAVISYSICTHFVYIIIIYYGQYPNTLTSKLSSFLIGIPCAL